MAAQDSSKLNKDLKSKDISTIIDSIDKIRDEGNIQSLDILVELYETIDNKDILSKISGLFCDLHKQETVQKMVEYANNKDLIKSRKMILSACWQSRLDFSDHLETFINIVINEPFELSFEAFTIIENIEIKFTPTRKAELVKHAKNALKRVKDENIAFANDMIPIIESYQEI